MFTRKEHALFADPYFRIIREQHQYVELQSLNTGYCWNVFKNQFEAVNKIKLYQKKKESDVNYRDYKLCRTVVEAIDEIKACDNSVLEKARLKKERGESLPEEPTRRLKVYSQNASNSKPASTIILKGAWLETWGFEAGDSIEVTCKGDGELEIKVAD